MYVCYATVHTGMICMCTYVIVMCAHACVCVCVCVCKRYYATVIKEPAFLFEEKGNSFTGSFQGARVFTYKASRRIIEN